MPTYKMVEQLCDYGAREILVQRMRLKELKTRQLSLETAAAIAEEADCYIQVVAECICDLPGQREGTFLFGRMNGDNFDLTSVVPASATQYEVASRDDSLYGKHIAGKCCSVVIKKSG